jgi:lysophospholipase L1-like esterase
MVITKLKNALFYSIGISFSLLFGVFVLEVLFGNWIFVDEWNATKSLNIIRNKRIEYSVAHLYTAQPPSILYTRDEFGLRGGCRDPGEIRILTIGGSTTDQRYIDDDATYQAVLQTKLTNYLAKAFCISNAGVDGHSTFGHIASFDEWFPLIPNLKPDFFLFYVGINDAGFNDGPNHGYDDDKKNMSKFRFILQKNSAIYSMIWRVREAMSSVATFRIYAQHTKRSTNLDYSATNLSDNAQEKVLINASQFRNRFQTLLEKTKAYKAKPICVSQPNLLAIKINGNSKGIPNAFEYKGKTYNGLDYNASLNELNQVMRELCLEAGGYFIDISNLDFGPDDFYDYSHLTPGGTNKLGIYLFDEFQKQNIISK